MSYWHPTKSTLGCIQAGERLDALAAYWALSGVRMTIDNSVGTPTKTSRVIGFAEATRLHQRLRGLASMAMALQSEIEHVRRDVVDWVYDDSRPHADRDREPGPSTSRVSGRPPAQEEEAP